MAGQRDNTGDQSTKRTKLRVSKSSRLPAPTVTVTIRPGMVAPSQKTAYHRFFSRLITECRRDLKAEGEAKK
jgi:hypothetical protein